MRENSGSADGLELEFGERWWWAGKPTGYGIDSCRTKLTVTTSGAC